MPRRLWTAVYREMFRRCERLQIFRIVPLQSSDIGNTHLRRQKRVFTIGFLAATPTWITKNVDIRRPDGEPVEPVAVTLLFHAGIVFGPELCRNNASFLVEQVRIECC